MRTVRGGARGAQGAVRKMRAGQGLIWVLHRADLARSFDRVLVLKDGRLVEEGPPKELDRPGSAFTQLLTAD